MLGLKSSTPSSWARLARADLATVLADHAHCELKAASNALALVARTTGWPRVSRELVLLAEEELRHYRAVLVELERRSIALGPPEPDTYAAELRTLCSRAAPPRVPQQDRRGAATRNGGRMEVGVADRLIVAALIEARSCERFRILAQELRDADAALSSFYDELFAAEARHARTFVELAGEVLGDVTFAQTRFSEFADLEGRLSARFGVSPTMHG